MLLAGKLMAGDTLRLHQRQEMLEVALQRAPDLGRPQVVAALAGRAEASGLATRKFPTNIEKQVRHQLGSRAGRLEASGLAAEAMQASGLAAVLGAAQTRFFLHGHHRMNGSIQHGVLLPGLIRGPMLLGDMLAGKVGRVGRVRGARHGTLGRLAHLGRH
mmetsp:Transcript_82054/g.142654  ORF Transcript_82054/g.142654 Transcript_82054/m.142654 type:complete len:160 (-) Transcript_82054:958-1437(-)